MYVIEFVRNIFPHEQVKIRCKCTSKPGYPEDYAARGFLAKLWEHYGPITFDFDSKASEDRWALLTLIQEGFVNIYTDNKDYE